MESTDKVNHNHNSSGDYRLHVHYDMITHYTMHTLFTYIIPVPVQEHETMKKVIKHKTHVYVYAEECGVM